VIILDFSLLGKRIRDERLLLRLTLEQLAEKIDKTGNYIGQIERGNRKLSLETLVDIANALGTTVDYLLSDNLRVSDENISKEIQSILSTMDNRNQKFILDITKRCKEYVTDRDN
jgi:transcriptional regulator with XRE-family HTH domain